MGLGKREVRWGPAGRLERPVRWSAVGVCKGLRCCTAVGVCMIRWGEGVEGSKWVVRWRVVVGGCKRRRGR